MHQPNKKPIYIYIHLMFVNGSKTQKVLHRLSSNFDTKHSPVQGLFVSTFRVSNIPGTARKQLLEQIQTTH